MKRYLMGTQFVYGPTHWILLLVVSLVVGLALLHDNFRAEWGMVDDHEIMHFMGADGRMSLDEVLPVLKSTELGALGKYTRCRPSYFAIRVFETFVFGDSVHLWYLARFVIFVVSFALFWRLLAWHVGLLPAFLIALSCMTFQFWRDIFSRLGPGEIYCTLGLAMFAYGVFRVMVHTHAAIASRHQQGFSWLLFIVGALLAVGSKENFVLLLLPVWIVGALLLYQKRVTAPACVAILIVSLFSLFIGVCVLLAAKKQGVDIYENSVGLGDRLALLGTEGLLGVALDSFRWWHAIALSVCIGCVALVARHERRVPKASLVKTGAVLLGLVLIWVSQFVFYNGAWPTGGRYDFPGQLVFPLIWTTLAVVSIGMLERLPLRRRVLPALKSVALILLLALIVVKGFPLRDACHNNKVNTRAFWSMFQTVLTKLRENPDQPLVLVCHSPWDYEPIVSAHRFLRAHRIQTPLFLLPNWPEHDPQSVVAVEASLMAEMEHWSTEGDPGALLPLAQLPQNRPCFGLGFSGPVPDDYVDLGLLWTSTH